MLDIMRKHAQSWFIKVLLGGIVVTFISWGGYSRYAARSNTVAYVNGEALMIQDFERAYFQALNAYRLQMPNLDEAAIKRMGLRQRIYDQLVQQMLMLQEADRLGLAISAKELRDRITQYDVFQVEGHFNEAQYRRILAANNMTPAQFEEQQTRDALVEKLRHLVTGFAKVSSEEAFAEWRRRNEKAAVDYAAFATDDFKPQVKITDQDMADYYGARKQGYEVPAKVKVGYVVFDIEALAKEITPSEQEIRDEYDSFQDDYWTDKEVKARHILLTLHQGASREKVKETEQKIRAILAEAKSGADFSELAKKYSQDPGTAVKGGDLGWFGPGQMVEPFEEAAFALAKGEVSEPVRTRFGYHLIKVDDIREPRLRPFEEVHDEIAKMLARDRAEELASRRVADSYGKLAKIGDLKKFAEQEGLKYQETGLLRQGPIPGLADSSRAMAKAHAIKVGEFDSDQERELGPMLFQVLDRREAYVPPLEEVKDKVRQKMTLEKARELAARAAAAALQEVRAGATLEEAAAKHGGKAGHAGPFLRNGAPAEVNGEAGKAAFKLTAAEPLVRRPYRNSTGFVIMKLTGRQEPSREEFAAHKDEATQRLLSFKRREIFDQWLKRLREKADIEVVNEIS